MEFTVFRNVASRTGDSLVSMEDFSVCIAKGTVGGYDCTGIIAQIRKAAGEGLHEEVRLLKMKLPAMTFAGNCMNGRFYPKTTCRTGLAMFDIDKVSSEQISAAKKKLMPYPWVAMVYTTCSGQGLRVVANLGIVHIDVYRDAYEIVAGTIAHITGLELDMQCKDFARMSLMSHDTAAFFNFTPEVYPYPPSHNPLNYKPCCGPDTSEDFRVPALSDQDCKEMTVTAASNIPEHNMSLDVRTVVDRFFSINSYERGQRHRVLLRLGGYLRWRGLGSSDLHPAIEYTSSIAASEDMKYKEIRDAMVWGFANGTEPPKDYVVSAIAAGKTPLQCQTENSGDGQNWVKRGKKVYNVPFSGENTVLKMQSSDIQRLKSATQSAAISFQEEDECLDTETEDELIDRLCPSIPEEVYGVIPEFIRDITETARTARERDVLAVSTIVNLSAVFCNLRTLYGDRWYSPHLYFCVVGGAGSGKGKAMAPSVLCSKIEDEYEKAYRSSMAEYREKLAVWEVEQRTAIREQRKPNFDLCPEEPVRESITMQTNISKSRMLHNLKINEKHGMIMNLSEMDTMTSALNADYGRHTSFLRGIFHHEEIGQDFKVDSAPVVVRHPSLACNISATFGQLVSFINNVEDGMYSRFLFYLLPTFYEWISPAPRDSRCEIGFEKMMATKASVLRDYFFRYDEKIVIEFTEEQWDLHEQVFGGLMKSISNSGKEGIKAIVARAGLIACRIAMTLCGVQIMEAGWKVSHYVCPDDIMKAAIDITITCFSHSLHLSTIFRAKENRDRMQDFNREDGILEKMPASFTYTEFMNAGMKHGWSKSSLKNDLRKLLRQGKVEKKELSKLYHKTKASTKKVH